jgi:hypothetical protein
LSGLITVPDVASMAEPIIRLLRDPAARHCIERPAPEELAPYQWGQCARVQKKLYDELLNGG